MVAANGAAATRAVVELRLVRITDCGQGCLRRATRFHPIYGNLLGVAISHENPLNGPAKMRRRAFQAAPLNRRWEK